MKGHKRTRRPRVKPLIVYTRWSPNHYDGGIHPEILTVHSTESHNEEGITDLKGIADYFGSASSQVSAHAVTDADGHSAHCVRDTDTAWHVLNDNDRALGVEQIGNAAQNHWSARECKETARWLAQWSHVHGIPLRHSTKHGVCKHKDLGANGGGHIDPGTGYPMRRTIAWAIAFRTLRYGPIHRNRKLA